MILTEEDLERIRYKYTQSHFGGRNSYSIIDSEIAGLIASHRLLIAANAELSFKNMKYKKGLFDAYDFIFTELAIPKHFREKFYRILLIDCDLDPNIRKLEETIHE